MVESDVPAEVSGTRRTFLRIVMSLGLGLVVGAVTYYVTALAAAVQISGNFTNNPLTIPQRTPQHADLLLPSFRKLAVRLAGPWQQNGNIRKEST